MPHPWKPVTRGKIEVVGVHPEKPELLAVRVPLSAKPWTEWQWAFENRKGQNPPSSFPRPDVQEHNVYIYPPDAELEAYVRDIDDLIAATNTWFQQNAVPPLSPEQKALDERIAAANARAAKL